MLDSAIENKLYDDVVELGRASGLTYDRVLKVLGNARFYFSFRPLSRRNRRHRAKEPFDMRKYQREWLAAKRARQRHVESTMDKVESTRPKVRLRKK